MMSRGVEPIERQRPHQFFHRGAFLQNHVARLLFLDGRIDLRESPAVVPLREAASGCETAKWSGFRR